MRPDTNFQGYRKVIVDPGVVAMRKGWLKSINAYPRTLALACP